MAVLKKAKLEDFEAIYPLLLDFNNPRITKDDWKQLFIKHWDRPEDYFGYMLVDGDKVVGFLNFNFSTRVINNEIQKFCNLGSWIVKKEYRSEAVLLLLAALKLKEYTITDFTPSREAYLTLKKFRFKDIETDIKIILPVPIVDFLTQRLSVEFDRNIIKNYLDEKDLKIYYDHFKFKNIYLLIRSKDESCYIIINKTRRKRLAFGRIHYVSNMDIFLKCINKVNMKICWHLKVCGLLIDERYLGENKMRYSVTIKRRYPSLFKSEVLEKDNIDTLYSELLILDL